MNATARSKVSPPVADLMAAAHSAIASSKTGCSDTAEVHFMRDSPSGGASAAVKRKRQTKRVARRRSITRGAMAAATAVSGRAL